MLEAWRTSSFGVEIPDTIINEECRLVELFARCSEHDNFWEEQPISVNSVYATDRHVYLIH